jgi:hypothetical protein
VEGSRDPGAALVSGPGRWQGDFDASFRPSRGPVLVEPRDGAANVLYQENRILVTLKEQRIVRDPETGRPPAPEDRGRFGEQVMAIVAEMAGQRGGAAP